MLEKALQAFRAVITAPTGEHTELTDLEKAGWREMCPSEGSWHFYNPKFPGVSIDWLPGYKPRGHEIPK